MQGFYRRRKENVLEERRKDTTLSPGIVDGRAGSREVNFLTGRILAHELVGEGESALSGLTGSQGA